jgi:hypothetical protein
VSAIPLPSADEQPAVWCVPCPASVQQGRQQQRREQVSLDKATARRQRPGALGQPCPLVRPAIERGRADHQIEGRRLGQGSRSAVPTTKRSRSSVAAALATSIMAGAASIPARTSAWGPADQAGSQSRTRCRESAWALERRSGPGPPFGRRSGGAYGRASPRHSLVRARGTPRHHDHGPYLILTSAPPVPPRHTRAQTPAQRRMRTLLRKRRSAAMPTPLNHWFRAWDRTDRCGACNYRPAALCHKLSI